MSVNILAVLFIGLAPFPTPAQEQRLSQYTHRAWLVRDGFFGSAPRTVTQTSDGYIWIGTDAGVFRFDGSRFEPWSSPDNRKLPSNVIITLLGARDGSLWIGMTGGLAHFVDHKLFVYPDFHDDVNYLFEDKSGLIWFSRGPAGGGLQTPICQAYSKTVHCLDRSDGVTTQSCCAHTVAQDTQGYLWITTSGALLRWKPGHVETYQPDDWKGLQNAESVVAMPDGSVLVGVAHPGAFGGIQKLWNGTWKPVKVPGFDGSRIAAAKVFRDRDGGIWLGAYRDGIYHIHNNVFEKFGVADGLSGDFVREIYQDRENGIWVATSNGVDYFHSCKITTFSKREGLAADNADGVTFGNDNAVWLSNDDSLEYLKNGRVISIRASHGLPGRMPTAVFEDSFGALWSGVDHDLYRYAHGEFQKVHWRRSGSLARYIVGIAEDSGRDIWAEVSGDRHELIRVHDLQVVEEYPEEMVPSARALAAGSSGVLWLGLRTGDLARFHDGHAEVFPSPGGPKSSVYQVVVNPDGTVFATSSAGLVGWKDGTSHLLSSKNGLLCDVVFGAAWDNQDTLWLHMGCGLARIRKEDVDRWWRDDSAVIPARVLDASDGVQPGRPNFNPMVRTPDGRLWFVNNSVLQMIDPAHLAQNDVLPPVQIERVVADRKSYEPFDKLTLPPLMLDLEIDYAALSFINPREVRFRYKLEGRDTTWQEAGTRRQAFYTDLPPRSYRFRVIASNNDGLWNEEGASVDFTVAPAWYQTAALRISSVLAGIFLLWLLYYLRMKQAARSIRARFDERISERTRLARDLHDTLLQTLQGSKLVADDALENRHDVEHTGRSLAKLSEWIDRAALEGRAALNALHYSAFDNRELSKRLQSALDDHDFSNVSERILIVNGRPVEMDPLVTDEICRVAYEAIRNAFLHSHAARIEVQLTYSEDFRLSVRDNGRGMDALMAAKGRPCHYGLRTMRERAARIDGQFQITTAPDLGTVVELNVPGKTAYQKEAGFWSKVLSWTRNFRGTEA